METPTAYISVAEAAKALGLHQNSIRKRIKTGKYTPEWAPSPHGPIQLIPRDQVFGGGMEPPTPIHALPMMERPQSPDMQQMLSTFVQQLEITNQENGRLKAELAHVQNECRELKEKLAIPASVEDRRPTSWWSRILHE